MSEHPAWQTEQAGRLEAEGYLVELADVAAVRAATGSACDAVVLDLDLPHEVALELCAALRGAGDVPILGVAPRELWDRDEIDVLAGEVDQLAPAPVRARELVARTSTLIRRCPAGAPPLERPEVLEAGSIVLDEANRVATIDGERVALTQPEFEVLQHLLVKSGRVVTREELAMPYLDGDPDRALDTVVRRVRSKLESVEGTRRIVAVRGVGFRLLQDA